MDNWRGLLAYSREVVREPFGESVTDLVIELESEPVHTKVTSRIVTRCTIEPANVLDFVCLRKLLPVQSLAHAAYSNLFFALPGDLAAGPRVQFLDSFLSSAF